MCLYQPAAELVKHFEIFLEGGRENAPFLPWPAPIISLPWVSAANISGRSGPLPHRSQCRFALEGRKAGFDQKMHPWAGFRRGKMQHRSLPGMCSSCRDVFGQSPGPVALHLHDREDPHRYASFSASTSLPGYKRHL